MTSTTRPPRLWPLLSWPEQGVRPDMRDAVLCLRTPDTQDRRAARVAGRAAAMDALRRWYPDVAVDLWCRPGHPPEVDIGGVAAGTVGVSFSHAPGCTLVALGRGCRVGVDLSVPQLVPDLRDVIRDYLDECVAKRLQFLTQETLQKAFFEHWTALEASFKCRGQALSERALRPPDLFHGVELKRLFCDKRGVATVAWYESSPQP